MAKKITVKEAVDKAGGIRTVADLCGISTQAVHQWIVAGRVGNLKRAIVLAEAAKIDVKQLA